MEEVYLKVWKTAEGQLRVREFGDHLRSEHGRGYNLIGRFHSLAELGEYLVLKDHRENKEEDEQ